LQNRSTLAELRKGKVWGHYVPENRDFEFRRLELFLAGAKVRVEKVSAAGWPV
jgi:hypothetical protein